MSKRNLSGSTLLGSSPLAEQAELDPMESMGNLMDVMLVFACGLLLALVANWSIDLTGGFAPSEPDYTPLDGNLTELDEGVDFDKDSFSEYGTVYRDEDTGDLYLSVD